MSPPQPKPADGAALWSSPADPTSQQSPSDDSWLSVDDRRATRPAQDADKDALPVDDRLSARTQATLGHRRWEEPLARFAAAAQRLAGAEGQPGPSAEEIQQLVRQVAGPLASRLEAMLGSPYTSPDLWKGVWYVGQHLLRSQASGMLRRLDGAYEIDDFGRDLQFVEAVMPLGQFLFETYWRVEVTGLEHVPRTGPALLISNHSGVLPFDGAMISTAVYSGSADQRLPRALVASWFPTLPFVSILLQRTGQVQASPHNAARLLAAGELVVVFPEGIRGVGKLYRERYRLARFGRGGFIKLAALSGVPMIPVAVVGAEEIYPVLARVDPLARLLGLPFFPITPSFPWTGPLGLLPLPSKWSIDFGKPIHLDTWGERTAANPVQVARLTEQVRNTIQLMLFRRLAKRRSIFRG